jgi:hypothetical protein
MTRYLESSTDRICIQNELRSTYCMLHIALYLTISLSPFSLYQNVLLCDVNL